MSESAVHTPLSLVVQMSKYVFFFLPQYRYFVEKSPEDGVEYCKRKVVLLRANMEKLLEVINQKKKQSMAVQEMFQNKMQAMQAQMDKKNSEGVAMA